MTDLVGRHADERLLADDAERPASLGRPEPVPRSPRRARIVAAGVTLTGATLVLGVALLALGLVLALTGGSGALVVGAFALGGVLTATHWGWVHVAELAGDAAQRRDAAGAVARRARWLAAIAPYARTEVATEVTDDGSVAIVRTRYVPEPLGADRFAFARERAVLETLSGDAPGAEVTERAELARRDAATETERARDAYAELAGADESRRLAAADDAESADARRAASRALSERINERLSDPPLSE